MFRACKQARRRRTIVLLLCDCPFVPYAVVGALRRGHLLRLPDRSPHWGNGRLARCSRLTGTTDILSVAVRTRPPLYTYTFDLHLTPPTLSTYLNININPGVCAVKVPRIGPPSSVTEPFG